jgi:hypothetical protein
VIIVYRARVTGGTLTPCAENDLLEWRAPAEIPWATLAFDSTREALREGGRPRPDPGRLIGRRAESADRRSPVGL